jgi:hypothetical protein
MATAELQEHARVAARRYEALRSCAILDFVAHQEISARHATEPIVTVAQIRCPAVGVEDTRSIWQPLDLPTTCLTIVAVAHDTQDWFASGLAPNAAAGA